MLATKLALALTIAAIAVGGCGTDDPGEVGTSAPAPSEGPTLETMSAPLSGDAILIQTRITNAREHIGEVLDTSVIGESAFCHGGKATGGSEGAAITSTFTCERGTLKVRFAPTQPSLVQGATWEIVDATGSFKGLRGGGSMVAVFERDDPDAGGETFTGIVSK